MPSARLGYRADSHARSLFPCPHPAAVRGCECVAHRTARLAIVTERSAVVRLQMIRWLLSLMLATAATCDEIDACVNYPCSMPEIETCTDVPTANGGVDGADGRVCTGNPCSAESAGSLADRGYAAETPTATTVAGLGQLDCAPGYMRASSLNGAPPTARCRTSDGGNTPGQFEFEGCVEAVCSGVPSFLDGFDLTGVDLPTRPQDSAVTGLSACLANRLPTGSVPLTVRCGTHGLYQQDNPGPDDVVCEPCTVVVNAAVEACTYTIPDVPPVGTLPLSAEATKARIDLCAAVDISGSDASADELACTSAGAGGICAYLVVRLTSTFSLAAHFLIQI